ncbi:MAG: aminotransferase class IV [Acidobacteriaceae bacterium]|nr:aminotransferase class IV [Acidobacteriaceae bacterium]
MHRHLLHNDAIRDTTEALIAPGQVGFMNGWGIFSTLRVADGVLFAFERHYHRMRKDAARMHVPFEMSAAELKQTLLTLVEANNAFDATLRVALVRNHGGLFEAPNLTRKADLIAFTTDLNDWGSGVKLGYMPHARHGASPFAGTKYTSWAENLTWYEMAHQRGLDEFILLNEHAQVSECTSANIFAIAGDRVWTPPLETSGCLPGVTRAILLEEIQVPGLTIAECEITPSELESCDGVFITSTTRDLLPVLEIDGATLNNNSRWLADLQHAFRRYRDNYIVKAKDRKHTFAA